MSNKQARAKDRLRLANIILVFSNGDVAPMDITKVDVIDIASGEPLFKRKESK